LTAELSGAVGVESCAIATKPSPNNVENITSVSASLFNADYLLLHFPKQMTHYVPDHQN
jgi:hypothetical protein